MKKSEGTVAYTLKIPEAVYAGVVKQAEKKGQSRHKYMQWAIKEAIRADERREEAEVS